jgi:Transglycosylase
MHRLNPKYIRIAGIVVISLVILLSIGGYIAYTKRSALLQKAIGKAKLKARKDYNLDVQIGSAHFTGLSTISFSDITVIPNQRDSLLNIKKFDISVKLMPLLFGNIKLSDVILENGHLNLTSIKGVKNFDFLFKRKKDTTENQSKADLSELAYNLINQILYKIPDNLNVKDFLITFADDSAKVKMLAQTVLIKNGNLSSTINIDNGAATWHLAGKMHPSDKEIDVRLFADGKKVEIPVVEKRYHLKLNFDTITTRLEKVKNSDGITKIYGFWSVRNLLINHPALSATDIVVPYGSIDANVFVGQNYVSLDSTSLIHLKKITIKPYLKYKLNPVKIYTAKVNTDWLNAQDVFDSFPEGMFESLDGIKVSGKLKYHLHLFLDTSQPDSVQFESALAKDNFTIVKYGKTDLRRLNGVFVYTPYEKGKPMPSRIIGPQNPDFTPLEDISPDLRNAVMTAEDPSFYTNHGFVGESIRRSIATNFKEKKFKRGGSTISMQLVKNTFLSRQKTLARKIEEIMIVWLIENNNVMSKNRMLEVYFNIIEWGRNIYGIGEASHYYFGKSPSELTLGECIYLASIVPHPKTGLYSFLPDGTLRPGLQNYFNMIGKLMAGRGLTEADSTGYGYTSVKLREALREEIAPVPSSVADSLMKQTNDDDEDTPIVVVEPEKKPNFLQRLFGKKDTAQKKEEKKIESEIDTVGKTKKQIRQERRALKKLEKERQKELKDKGLL